MLIDRRLLRNFDYALLGAAVIAVLFGCAMIYSATRWNTRLTAGNPFLYVKKQLLAAALGAVGSLVILAVDYHYLERFAKWIYVIRPRFITVIGPN
jgi:cell division protein FtsW (lipid II flippase)